MIGLSLEGIPWGEGILDLCLGSCSRRPLSRQAFSDVFSEPYILDQYEGGLVYTLILLAASVHNRAG
jgi:hypothetical protein